MIASRGAGEPDYRAAVEKACGLLRAFGVGSGQVVGVSELARRAGLPKSTAHRQLNILERADMVERCGRGYRIGPGLRTLALGASDMGRSHLGDVLLPYLVQLFEITRLTVQLAVLEEHEVMYLGKISGHDSVATPCRIGSRLPAHCTAGGKLLLSHHSYAASVVLGGSLRGLTLASTTNPGRLKAELGEIRRKSLAFDAGGADLSLSCIAAPVVTPGGAPVAALSLCAPRGTNLTAVAEVLSRVAVASSRHLKRSMPMEFTG